MVRLGAGFTIHDMTSRKNISKRPITREQAEAQLMKFNSLEKEGKIVPSKAAPKPLISGVGMPGWIEPGTAEYLAKAAYSRTPPARIGPYQLVTNTPTLKFYRDKNKVIIAIRGTQDQRDVASWALVATSQVKSGARYQEDIRVINSWKQEHEMEDLDYYAVGHSLAGSLADILLRDGEILEAISFNPAVQLGDLRAKLNNFRIYNYNDPLYALMGHLADNTTVVGGISIMERFVRAIPFYGQLVAAYSKLYAHKIESLL